MRALFVSHTGMTEPLGHSQVLPYVRGLVGAGWQFEIIGFEPASAPREQIESLSRSLEAEGIRYSWTQRSTSHSLPTKVWESGHALLRVLTRALSARPDIVHGRSYIASAVAGVAARLSPGSKFIFDGRGLLADEYVDANHWIAGSPKYKLVKTAERLLFRADGIVTLTDSLRSYVRNQGWVRPQTPIQVVPCCADLEIFKPDAAARNAARRLFQAGDRLVLVYSGTLGSWYRADEMVALLAAVKRRRPAMLVVLTRSKPDEMKSAMERHRLVDSDVVFRSATPVEMPGLLPGADVGLSFISPCFSKMASSPTKVGEYLGCGLRVAVNRGVGDGDLMIDAEPEVVIDAGDMGADALARAACQITGASAGDARLAIEARRVATERLGLHSVAIPRYRDLYQQLLNGK